MQNGGPDYKKLYEESLERLARAEAQHQRQSLQYQQQAKDYQQQIGQYEQEFIILKHELNQLRRRVFGITSDNQVKKAIEELLSLPSPVNAILFTNNILSTSGLIYINSLTVTVPADISIVYRINMTAA